MATLSLLGLQGEVSHRIITLFVRFPKGVELGYRRGG
jgi:hypothetical protein